MNGSSTWLTVLLCLLGPAAGAQTPLFTETGEADFDFFGAHVAVLGDLDGDGVNEYGISAPFNDATGNRAGKVRIVSGRTRTMLYTWFGSTDDTLGSDLTSAGDLNGDGIEEVAVGASGGNYALVYDGASGTVLHTLTGPTGSFGASITAGGDVDADGVGDLLVGAPGNALAGALVVFSGATGLPLRTHTFPCSGQLGAAASFLGDQDGDGRDEYAIGRPLSIIGCGSPEVLAFDGATGTQLWTNAAPMSSDQLGYALARLQDVNGDGFDELLAGAPQDPGVGCGPCNGKGYVRCLDGATGATLWQVNGVFGYTGLGTALAALGDLDGNGFEDFAVSQPGSSGSGCGSFTPPLQLRDGLTGALLLEIPEQQAGNAIGSSLASGDLNGDGLRDLLVGAVCDDAGGLNSGAAYAYSVVLEPTNYCEAKLNSQACLPSIFATGTPSLTTATFRIRAQDEINQKFGVLFWGREPAAAPFQGGTLCVAPPLTRTPAQSSGGNAGPDDCSGTYVFHFSGLYMTAVGVLPGDTIYSQYWSRDPSSVSGTGLTGGLAFRVLP